MVSNKKRLYVALYPAGTPANSGEQLYHWSLLVGPKDETSTHAPGIRYHVVNPRQKAWQFEALNLTDVRGTARLLGRVLIGKITDEARLDEILRAVPVVQNNPNWRCRYWVSHAVRAIKEDGKCVGTGVLDWEAIERKAKEYVGRKVSEGRYRDDPRNANPHDPKPTWSMIDNAETVS